MSKPIKIYGCTHQRHAQQAYVAAMRCIDDPIGTKSIVGVCREGEKGPQATEYPFCVHVQARQIVVKRQTHD